MVLLLRVGGRVAGWVGGLSENGNKAISASIEVEVELRLSLAKIIVWLLGVVREYRI